MSTLRPPIGTCGRLPSTSALSARCSIRCALGHTADGCATRADEPRAAPKGTARGKHPRAQRCAAARATLRHRLLLAPAASGCQTRTRRRVLEPLRCTPTSADSDALDERQGLRALRNGVRITAEPG